MDELRWSFLNIGFDSLYKYKATGRGAKREYNVNMERECVYATCTHFISHCTNPPRHPRVWIFPTAARRLSRVVFGGGTWVAD